MQITSMCKALALHEIFDDRDVGPRGCLPLSEIETAWRVTGLRRDDLVAALADARVTGEFAVHESGDVCRVVLTEVGYERSQRDLSSLRDIEELVEAYSMLNQTRERRPTGAAFGRRTADQVNA
jgi:hypothetical protein